MTLSIQPIIFFHIIYIHIHVVLFLNPSLGHNDDSQRSFTLLREPDTFLFARTTAKPSPPGMVVVVLVGGLQKTKKKDIFNMEG
jgi:hypothetical protein